VTLVLAEQISWPEFVATVKGVAAALPADERATALILTNDDRLSDGRQPQPFRQCVFGIRGGRVGVSVHDLPLAVLPAEHRGGA
jgi:hypothetical protein